MSEKLPQLSPEIASLLAREKDGYPSDHRVKAEVLAHVEWVVALEPVEDLLQAEPRGRQSNVCSQEQRYRRTDVLASRAR